MKSAYSPLEISASGRQELQKRRRSPFPALQMSRTLWLLFLISSISRHCVQHGEYPQATAAASASVKNEYSLETILLKSSSGQIHFISNAITPPFITSVGQNPSSPAQCIYAASRPWRSSRKGIFTRLGELVLGDVSRDALNSVAKFALILNCRGPVVVHVIGRSQGPLLLMLPWEQPDS